MSANVRLGDLLPHELQVPSDGAGRVPQERAGVSVIVPSHRGRQYIYSCLRSLGQQRLDSELFDVIVVLNGEPDGSRDEIDRLHSKYPHVDLHVLETSTASAAVARNLGIAASRRQYVTFVDDDDTVSPAYLSVLLSYAEPGVLPMAHIVDIEPSGRAEPDNRIGSQIVSYAGQRVHASVVPRALAFNACKLIPRQTASSVRYDPELKSGDDIDFFMRLVVDHDFELFVSPIDSGPTVDNAVYYRRLRENSLSRQILSFAFNVTERMEVISRLDLLAERCSDGWRRELVLAMLRGQATFVRRYVEANPAALASVLDVVDSYGATNFPYQQLSSGLARSLVVSYCFAPYSDTSAIVMAKRVQQRGEVVDVIYNAMDSVRSLDPSTELITRGMVDQGVRLPTPTGFSSWRAVESFCLEGLASLERLEAAGKHYERMYSRVSWPPSHFLAAVHKARRPELWWSAEFSDPVSHGIDGNERFMTVADGPLHTMLEEIVASSSCPSLDTANGFRWCEYLAYLLADELLFTNEKQLAYMLGYCEHPELAERARRIARIDPHPTLPGRFYGKVSSSYQVDCARIHLAYFGAFYATRGLDDVLLAMSNLEISVRDRLLVHVFTGQGEALRSRAAELGIESLLVVNGYVPFLEFLSLTTRFDWLIVNDAATVKTHPANPYLPSKISDYAGSGGRIWGITERGSALSTMSLDHVTELGDIDAALSFLRMIAATPPDPTRGCVS